MSTNNEWSDKLPEYILDKIREKHNDISWRFPDDDYIPQILHGFRDGYKTGALEYAELWYAAEIKAEKYEKALKEICGQSGQLVPAKHDMIAIATEAITPKTSTDEQA